MGGLRKSIKATGQQVPVVLWRSPYHDKLVVIDGHRRIKALQELELPVVQAVVRDDLSIEQAYCAAWEANTKRAAYGPLDRANAVHQIRKQQGMTIEQVAAFLGMTRATAGRLVKLLDLPAPLKDAVANRRITMNHALVLGQHPDEDHEALVARIEEEGMSIKALRKELGKAKRGRKKTFLKRHGKGFHLALRFSPKSCDPGTREEMLKALKEAVSLLEEDA